MRSHKYHIWDVAKVKALVADHEQAVTFFCGGSRNFPKFLALLDGVFILDIDLESSDATARPAPRGRLGLATGGTGTDPAVAPKEEIPKVGTIIDATVPITQVVDEILRQVEAEHR